VAALIHIYMARFTFPGRGIVCVVSGSGSCFGSGTRSGPGFGFAPGLITLRIQQ